jgi:hypothetical protein
MLIEEFRSGLRASCRIYSKASGEEREPAFRWIIEASRK